MTFVPRLTHRNNFQLNTLNRYEELSQLSDKNEQTNEVNGTRTNAGNNELTDYKPRQKMCVGVERGLNI